MTTSLANLSFNSDKDELITSDGNANFSLKLRGAVL
jgi:hypothetical protein